MFLQQLTGRSAFHCLEGTTPDTSVSAAHRDGGGNFRLAVELRVLKRTTPCRITLQEEEPSSFPYDISGSPFTLDWLMEQQKLGVSFGRADHR